MGDLVQARIQESAAVQDKDGNIVVVSRTVNVVGHVTGVKESQPPGRPAALPAPRAAQWVPVEHHDRFSKKSVLVFMLTIALTGLHFSMMVLGAIHIDSCPGDTSLGAYMVVQGLFGASITIIFAIWWCMRCFKRKILLFICVPIGAFIVIWFFVGTVWIAESRCTDTSIYRMAIGFTAPVWAILIAIVLIFCCCCCKD